MVDTESQSMKKSTEISTVKLTYDKTQTSSDKTSVDEKAQSVNSPGLEQDLSTNDITSETLTSELKTNLHTATMMSHLNTKVINRSSHYNKNKSEQEDKMTTETATEKTTISRNETSSPSVDVTGTRISTETTLESVTIMTAVKQQIVLNRNIRRQLRQRQRKQLYQGKEQFSSVDMTGTRISTETTPETTVEPVTINESVVKTKQNNMNRNIR
ncbi:unnamed protein product [Mytilus edulis]|uniref:Uncharacterized protein n=1 Tax=Mytilus edulis TaxID=6550 RepID=A0A8S3V1K2_MYTED|nr:unnamed protein product [Mytilus edulis]